MHDSLTGFVPTLGLPSRQFKLRGSKELVARLEFRKSGEMDVCGLFSRNSSGREKEEEKMVFRDDAGPTVAYYGDV
jgi:hypothetical protein